MVRPVGRGAGAEGVVMATDEKAEEQPTTEDDLGAAIESWNPMNDARGLLGAQGPLMTQAGMWNLDTFYQRGAE